MFKNKQGILQLTLIFIIVVGIILLLSSGYLYNKIVNTPVSNINVGDCVYDKHSNSYYQVISISNNMFNFQNGGIGFLTDKDGNPSGYTSLKLVDKSKC